MRFAMLSKGIGLVALVAGVSGCAAPARELPRHISQTSEAGFSTANPTQLRKIIITAKALGDLTADEKQRLQAMAGVQVIEDDQYGIVTDTQGVDQSTAGTNAGAALGGAVASAAYIDNALRGGRYSAVNQLAVGLLGAAAGSSLDSQATSKFQFRYAVKLGDGDIQYFDETKSTAFRHAVGVCLLTATLELVSQRVCNQTAESIRKAYLR